MTAIEKLRKLLTGKMPNGKTRAEACADSFVNCALTIGDCAELLQEIERIRTEAELDLEGEQWVRSVFAGQANAFEKERDAYRKALLEANRRRRSVREACARICDERAASAAKDLDAFYDAAPGDYDRIADRGAEAEACAAAIRAGGKP